MFLLPTLILMFLFSYLPIYGILVAFQDFRIGNQILSTQTNWVGLQHFQDFISSIFFKRVFGNTLRLSIEMLVFGFWVPIVFALLLNEVRHTLFKKFAQTFVYLPYFISTVVVVAILISLTGMEGSINKIVAFFGGEPTNMMISSRHFDWLYVFSGIWQTFGYSSIIYIASIAGIDPTLYEAATVDGANRLHKMRHITLPSISSTIIVLLILSVGGILNANTEKILLMKTATIADRAEVIGTYVYEIGIKSGKFSYTSAIGVFANIIGFTLVFSTNWLSRKLTDYSLW